MTVIDPFTSVLALKAHHGTLGLARSLGRWGVPVHVVHNDPDHATLLSRYVTGAYQWDVSRQPVERSIGWLLALGRSLGGRVVLIPTSDDTAELVAQHADALRPTFLFQDNRPELVRALSNKRSLHDLAIRAGIPTAETTFPQSFEEVRRFAAGASFPVMLKASDGLRLQARTGKKMVIVRTREELLDQYRRLEDPADPDLMLQEYIPGGDDTIWMFNGYFDAQSDCVFGVTGKKLRQYPVHTGATSLGICLENRVVRELTCRLVKATGYRGILDIGFRYDARDGGYKLLDPNPRIGQSFRLFVSREGMDVARYLYLDLTGQALPSATPVEGRKWVVEDWDLESALDYWREGSLSASEWIASFPGVEEAAWWSSDDRAPFWKVLRATARRARKKLSLRQARP
jgi:predicted ATP-grasp superfamily ATP-dependent carboligase